MQEQDIQEMLHKAEVKAEILKIAFNLLTDDRYTKKDAADGLVKLLDKYGFNE